MEDKTHKKATKKKPKRRRELTFKLLLYPITFGSCFCPPAFALSFQVLSLGIFFFSRGKKKHTHTKKKKCHREEKICREGRELTFKFSLCLFTFGSHFCPLAFALPFKVFSPVIFFFLSRKKKQKKKKKP
jgi:hypothetical protein